MYLFINDLSPSEHLYLINDSLILPELNNIKITIVYQQYCDTRTTLRGLVTCW